MINIPKFFRGLTELTIDGGVNCVVVTVDEC